MKTYGLIKELTENWFFGNERKILIPASEKLDDDLTEQLRIFGLESEAEFFEKANNFLDKLKAVNRFISDPLITAETASKIHGLTNRQVSDWDNWKLVNAHREGKGKRLYSVVDVAWLYILKSLQDTFGAQVQKTAERVKPLFDDNYLALCLTRDIHKIYKPFVYLDKEKGICFSYTGIGIPEEDKPELFHKIPLVPIMHMVASKSSIPGFATVVSEGKRLFQIEGNTFSIYDELREQWRERKTFCVLNIFFERLFPSYPSLFSDSTHFCSYEGDGTYGDDILKTMVINLKRFGAKDKL